MKMAFRLCALLFLASILWCAPAMAAFPDRPVTVVVGFAPGGAGDIIARAVAQGLEKELGQPVVIVNKGGSGGSLAVADVMSKPADGYTIAGTISSAITQDTLTSKTRYQLDDFSVLAITGFYQEGFFCTADKPWKTLRDAVEDAKKNNKPLTYPSSVVFDKIITRYISEKEGVDIRAVPVTSGAAIISSVLGGHTDFGISGGLQRSYVKAGQLRDLTSTGSRRSPYTPDVPTLLEEGWPLAFDNYFIFYVLKDVAQDIKDTLSRAFVAAAKMPACQEALENRAGVYPAVYGMEEATKILQESMARYRTMLQDIKK